MGDIMALIGRHEWLMNMVGTTMNKRTGADRNDEKHAMKKKQLPHYHLPT